jgi:hypothetical protein
MNYFFRHTLVFAGMALLSLGGVMSCDVDSAGDQLVPGVHPEPTGTSEQLVTSCVPDGSVDDTLSLFSCCSGFAVNGSTVCSNPADFGTTFASCRHVCGTAPVNGCIPSGGWDDTLSNTSCCSGKAVPGSTWCLDPRDFNTTFKSCVQRCQ